MPFSHAGARALPPVRAAFQLRTCNAVKCTDSADLCLPGTALCRVGKEDLKRRVSRLFTWSDGAAAEENAER